MATVQNIKECPQCGYKEAIYELSCGTLQESLFCPLCGYIWEVKPLIDRKKQKEDPEHREWRKFDKHDKIIFRVYERKGYGTYHIAAKNGISQSGRFSRPATEENIKDFIKVLSNSKVDVIKSYLTCWNPKDRRIEHVVGRSCSIF